MPYYETVFMARQDLSESQVKDLADRFTKVITDQGGKILKTENWGLRTLAYRINKARKAHYVLIESEASGDAMIELDRVMRLDEDVMRSLNVRLEEPTKEPSAILDKSKKDDERSSKDKPRKKEAA